MYGAILEYEFQHLIIQHQFSKEKFLVFRNDWRLFWCMHVETIPFSSLLSTFCTKLNIKFLNILDISSQVPSEELKIFHFFGNFWSQVHCVYLTTLHFYESFYILNSFLRITKLNGYLILFIFILIL